ncbi:MAG TPA: NAD(P)-dependent oxidoreductase [Acidobacteriota bacterium]|nr:NAD(P)-dependent oxidoreductase [Acidobacteriota bacterium]
MDTNLPGIIVTGASGFIGRHFLEAVAGKFRLFCLARRSQKEAGIPRDDNIRWTQVDIAKWDTLREVVQCVKTNGGADFVLHLAGYYDFSNADNPEYERTNVNGTRNVLKLAKQIGTRRFIFASSLAACTFPRDGGVVNEESAPDATFPYASSKRLGEEMMQEYSEWFPCTTVRLAAIYSDWCEYPPVYVFLGTWLSGRWNSRILGGRGMSAVTYLHIQDLIRFFLKIIDQTDRLPRMCTLVASPNGFTTHHELFKTATRYFYGRDIRPIRMPKVLATPGMVLRHAIGKLFGRPPFERLWMVAYIDKKLNVDASGTHADLGWQPTARHGILRRLLFLMENMKNHPDGWHLRNEAVLRRVTERPNLTIYELLIESREALIDEMLKFILAPANAGRLNRYQRMDKDLLKWYVTLVYQLVATVVRTRDRTLMRNYAEVIAYRRFVEGFEVREVCDFLMSIGDMMREALEPRSELRDMPQRVYDHITMTFQLAVDEIEDSYEFLAAQTPEYLQRLREVPLPTHSGDLERIVHQLEDICQDMFEDRLSTEARKLRGAPLSRSDTPHYHDL